LTGKAKEAGGGGSRIDHRGGHRHEDHRRPEAGKAAHRAGKRENFCTDGDRRVLIDFGSAELLGPDRLTRLDRSVGTEEYLPPEVALRCRFAETSDVWGVGVVLYAMQTGHLPYHMTTVRRGRRVPDYATLCTSDASRSTRAAVAAMLTLDPQRRPTPGEALQLLA
jgi:serine/threonine protein kinase